MKHLKKWKHETAEYQQEVKMANVFNAYQRMAESRRKALKEAYTGIARVITRLIPDYFLNDLELYFPNGEIDVLYDADTCTIIVDNIGKIEANEEDYEELEMWTFKICSEYTGLKLEGKFRIYLKEELIAFWMTKDIFEGYIEGEAENSEEIFLDDFDKVFEQGKVYILDNNDADLYIKADFFVAVATRKSLEI